MRRMVCLSITATVFMETKLALYLVGNSSRSSKRSRKAWEPPKVKTLAETDLDKYSIFDVIMPLPGKDVDFPGGALGGRYKEFLRRDGLDPDNFVRKQK